MTASNQSPTIASSLRRLPFYYGWVVVAVAFVTMAIGVNVRTAFSLLFSPILDEFGWARGTTAAAFSLGFVVATLYAPFIGVLMDRLGPRYVLPLGAVLVSSGLIGATFATEPWHLHLTLGVFGIGGGIALTYIGHGAFLPHWFVARRGLAIGIAFSGVGVGSILLFPWLQQVIDQDGWRQACWTMGLLLVVLVLPLNFFLQRQRPEDIGLRPDGDVPRTGDEAQKTSPRPDNVVDHAWAAIDWTLPRAVRTARFWWLALGLYSGLVAWYGIQVHQTKYLIDLGFSSSLAALALGLVPVAGIVAQIGIGHLSDRIGREWGWTLGSLGFALCYALLLLLPAFPNVALVALMVLAQGALGYGLAPMYSAVPMEIFQGRGYGTIFGTLSMIAGLGAASGPWMLGLLHDWTGDYRLGFTLAAALSLISVLAIWQAAPRKVRRVAGMVGR